jgi:hypothetical protein
MQQPSSAKLCQLNRNMTATDDMVAERHLQAVPGDYYMIPTLGLAFLLARNMRF